MVEPSQWWDSELTHEGSGVTTCNRVGGKEEGREEEEGEEQEGEEMMKVVLPAGRYSPVASPASGTGWMLLPQVPMVG